MANFDTTAAQFNSLLKQSQKAMTCGPDCQKIETAQTLKQAYLDAQANVETAPKQLEDAAKSYYTFTGGVAGYEDYLNKFVESQANTIIDIMQKSFADNLSTAKTIVNNYQAQIINANHAKQLYQKYLDENSILEQELKDNSYDVFTNDRKTYYEDQGIDNLNWWYKLFFRLFVILIIAYIILFFISSSNFSLFFRIIILACLIAFPYAAFPIYRYLQSVYYVITSKLPQNAYINI